MFKSLLDRKALLAGAALVAATSAALSAGQASAAVTAVTATVAPTRAVTVCPVTFNFTGRITSDREGIVRYRWVRSDGVFGPVKSITFGSAGTQTVTDSWTLAIAYTGWEALRIVSPNLSQSDHAKFSLGCKAPPPHTGGGLPQ
jgi:hypothetical protein